MAAKVTVGFIGTGVMGSSMAGHLLKAGYDVHVYTRTKARSEALIGAGAIWEENPAAIARTCDRVITMVGYPADVEEVYFGPKGIIENAKAGAILVDMTTSRPDLAAKIAKAAKTRGLGVLDAPVSGGDIGAKNATLTIMVGGETGDFEAMKPIFSVLGKTIVLQGEAGSGQHTKMANQIAIAASLMGAVEAITYAKSAGLDPRKVLESIGSGSAGSWQLNNLVPKMLDGNFEPGFYVKHFLKDLRIALESANTMNLELPLLRVAEGLYEILQMEGHGDKGTQALWLLYERGLTTRSKH